MAKLETFSSRWDHPDDLYGEETIEIDTLDDDTLHVGIFNHNIRNAKLEEPFISLHRIELDTIGHDMVISLDGDTLVLTIDADKYELRLDGETLTLTGNGKKTVYHKTGCATNTRNPITRTDAFGYSDEYYEHLLQLQRQIRELRFNCGLSELDMPELNYS